MNDTPPGSATPASDPVDADANVAVEAPAEPPLPTGPVRATISKGYRIRLLLIGLGLAAFGCWALYDGFIKYPKQLELYRIHRAYKEGGTDWARTWADYAEKHELEADTAVLEALPPDTLERREFENYKLGDRETWQTTWPVFAEERGMETNYQEIKELEEFDILTQYLMAAVCLPIGLWFLWVWLRAGGRWVEGDPNGVRNHEGVDLTWDQVTGIDDARWRNKGIAYLRYGGTGGGEEKRVLLDDWKFQREPTDAIYRLARANVAGEETQEPPINTDQTG